MKLKQTLVAAVLFSSLAVFSLAPALPAYAADKKLKCNSLPQVICDNAKEGTLEKSGTWLLLIFIINILIAGVGVVAVGMIVYAGFLYATAMDAADQVKKSKEIIRNVAIGIGVFAGMGALLNWLIPGGLLY